MIQILSLIENYNEIKKDLGKKLLKKFNIKIESNTTFSNEFDSKYEYDFDIDEIIIPFFGNGVFNVKKKHIDGDIMVLYLSELDIYNHNTLVVILDVNKNQYRGGYNEN